MKHSLSRRAKEEFKRAAPTPDRSGVSFARIEGRARAVSAGVVSRKSPRTIRGAASDAQRQLGKDGHMGRIIWKNPLLASPVLA